MLCQALEITAFSIETSDTNHWEKLKTRFVWYLSPCEVVKRTHIVDAYRYVSDWSVLKNVSLILKECILETRIWQMLINP